MNRAALAAAPLALAAVVALAGCSGTNGTTGPDTRPVPSSTSESTEPSTSTTSAPAVHDDATPQPAPAASAGAQDSAVTAAEKVVRTYAQPTLSADAWAQQMTPLLSQSGAVAYDGQDPTTIPAHKVTGTATVLPGATDVALNVKVPTDAGDYTVALSRSGTSAPWLADEIRPATGG
ncbi:hypothetical protein [Curtobacterium sp. VKM Ac-1395]|uniref:hypothetical protein n=1 Tax=Curtobacterium sp. VKM Ac-1395 TaxID=2783815 RepID=UPI00188B0724|nr:hypothetical protein [Curtobacterium sp. VKM Ac-1395]MBF4592082.1 hypothetical protein [Curtobacterium sp. VKM Ac-1395]